MLLACYNAFCAHYDYSPLGARFKKLFSPWREMVKRSYGVLYLASLRETIQQLPPEPLVEKLFDFMVNRCKGILYFDLF